MANGLSQKCTGVITRKRSTVVCTEESAIDFVCLSNDMQEDLVSINIDEERKLVNLTQRRGDLILVIYGNLKAN